MQLSTEQSRMISAASFLVTGGAGFIGSHIAEFLLNAGARKVTVLDNFDTGHFRNVAAIANHPNFEFMKGDVRDPDTCTAACKGKDYVFHQAVSEPFSGPIQEPLLMAAREAAIKRFVYAAGSPANANNGEYELYIDQFARRSGMETIGLRYFNVFGKRQDARSRHAAVIPRMVMQLIRHESPVVNGMGAYYRDFTYVENVVQANILAILATDAKAINQVYHIAFKERTSLHQLARYLKEFLSVFDESIAGIRIVHGPAFVDMEHSVAYIDKAKKLLGYQPCDSLRDGLLKSAAWYWTYLPQFDYRTTTLSA